MKIRRAECLLFVAIATSAVVAQIREHTLPAGQANASAQTRADQQTAGVQTCDTAATGMLRAACETRSERKPVDDSDRTINRNDNTSHAAKLWV
ncbi:hypothetical protein [Burkholderia sp. Ac-20365]|uniref:hypothetical protein n=1 Tax=Burkholderia sp. Ac-20365 TaxID=2703897 RepID=UPI00197BE1E2|nr:hypothetical protein [Burkholderia sp. Ac-20365]MBN3765312.1 hypothetical protein [Burkholderia sp. Ac-20365]